MPRAYLVRFHYYRGRDPPSGRLGTLPRYEKSAKKCHLSAERIDGTDVTYLSQAPEPFAVDRGLVHEDFLGAVIGGDEPEALLGVEPLHLGWLGKYGVRWERDRDEERTTRRVTMESGRRGLKRVMPTTDSYRKAIHLLFITNERTFPVSLVISRCCCGSARHEGARCNDWPMRRMKLPRSVELCFQSQCTDHTEPIKKCRPGEKLS